MDGNELIGCQQFLRIPGKKKHQALEEIASGYVKIAIENGPVEIVDFPSYKMVDLPIVM